MAVDPELLELMPDVVTIRRKASVNRFAEGTTTAVFTARAQVRAKTRRAVGASEILSTHTVILEDSYGITNEDELELQDGTVLRITDVDRRQDQFGNHHETVQGL
jgi:hypothetical protein